MVGREGRVLRARRLLSLHSERVDAAGPRGLRGERRSCAVRLGGLRRRARIPSVVDARLLFLPLYGGLDAASVGQGHAVELVEAPGVALQGEGTVHPALDAN